MNSPEIAAASRLGASTNEAAAITHPDYLEPVNRAYVARGEAVGQALLRVWHAAARAPGKLSDLMRGQILPWLKGQQVRHRTEVQLSALNDAMLRDIGVERWEIPMIARAAAATARDRLRAELRRGSTRPTMAIAGPAGAPRAENTNRPIDRPRHAGAA
jgi:uncharacterized protein YjiS (DUF1127 family)